MIKLCEENVEAIGAAVRADLGGPTLRGIFEVDVVTDCHTLLDHWEEYCETEHVSGTPGTFCQWGEVRKDPKGVMLLIAPWNFPIGLALKPLLCMLATGNCVVVKPSEVSQNCSKLLADLIPKYFPSNMVRVVEGAVPETTALLKLKWDHIMYTGNGAVARIVMKAAAEHLCPVTLELGGKCPLIIDETADIAGAVKKIFCGKWNVNTAQACIAADYVLIHKSKEAELIKTLTEQLDAQFGDTACLKEAIAKQGDDCIYGRIVNKRHVQRLKGLLTGVPSDQIVCGDVNEIDEDNCFVPPFVIRGAELGSDLMTQEIFGPILPIVTFDTIDQALSLMKKVCDRPLALYLHSTNKKTINHVLDNTVSGAVGVNNAPCEQALHPNLPFGGVGESGMGAYGGKHGVLEFCYQRSVFTRTTHWPHDLNQPIPPVVKGVIPSFLYGAAKILTFGLLSRQTKSLLKQVVTVALVGGLSAYAYQNMA